jgi:DNA polymerase-3 subunit gamma/tau
MQDVGFEPLALKYRPQRFSDFIGQQATRVVLEKMCREGKMDRPMVFAGVKGTGKTSAGRVVAAALNCEDLETVMPCTKCPSCISIANGTSTDVIEQDGASSGLVDDIRKLTDMLRYSTSGRYRVLLLDEAQSLSKAAFNALLKTLEEPPERTVFILLTTEPQQILGTVLSRCMVFDFRKVPKALVTQRLTEIAQAEEIDIEDELISSLADYADGSVRDSIMSLDQCARAGISTKTQYDELRGIRDFAPELISAMMHGSQAEVFRIIEEQLAVNGQVGLIQSSLVSCLRDILIVQSGGTIPQTGLAKESRLLLSQRLTSAKVITSMRVLWDGQSKFKTITEPRMQLDLVAVLLGEVLATKVIPVQQAPVRQRMSMVDIRSQL